MTKQEESTHFVFDGHTIQISPNIQKIFDFLMEIEKESNAIFGIEKQLIELRDYYKDLLDCTAKLSRVVKEHDIDGWSHTFKKDPRNFASALHYHIPIRTQMIQLFTQLEVMYFLYLAYTQEIHEEVQLRELAMKDKKLRADFLNQFILTDKNSYYNENIGRLKKLNAKKLIGLRNALVHFFSLSNDSIGIYADQFSDDARKFEQYAKVHKHDSLVMMSPSDLQGLLKSAYIILFKLWTEDTLNDKYIFRRKIQHVNNVVSEFGAVVVYYNNK